ncbi:hypothetical protein TNCV_4038451 [Trichonephila clavipes]|nr:hypothetical protein TNCV_4038451 [Trichonephila clavipes]
MCKLVLKKTPVPYDTPENMFSDDDLVDYARHLEMPIRMVGEKCYVPRPILFSTTYGLVTANQKFVNSPLEINCYQS